MSSENLTKTEETFKRLSACGRYVNTGKVLIGVAYCPRPRDMTSNEISVQSVLLGHRRWRVTTSWLCYLTLLTLAIFMLFAVGLLK